MNAYSLPHTTTAAKNTGDAKEWALASFYHIERTAHDWALYDRASDIEVGERHISVKSNGFTLMSGNLCEGLEDFDSIWALYKSRVHSNCFVYVTNDYIAYEMTIEEFEEFVFTFCRTERESEKNGGAVKIRCRHESKKMVRWLAARAI